MVIVVEIFVILQFCKNSKALKDEALLKRLYNERHDERAQQIEALASQKSVQIALILAVAAGFIVFYFSLEVMLPLKESMAITTFMYTLLLIFDGCITMVCSTVKVIAMCKYAYNKFYSIFLRHLSV